MAKAWTRFSAVLEVRVSRLAGRVCVVNGGITEAFTVPE
jgi:hypothetical protein